MDYSKALKCAILSQDIYQNFTQVKFQGFPNITPVLVDQSSTDTQCAILLETTSTSIYVVFRGSETRIDWNTNFNLEQDVVEFDQRVIQGQIVEDRQQVYPYAGESSSGARMHRGFASAYMSVRDRVHEFLRNNPVTNIIVTGHSLGGALATLCAVDIQYNFADKVQNIEIYTFGAPRVGNDGFRDSFNRRVPNSYRFIYGMDLVPALPRPWQGYSHVDREQRLGPRFSLNFITQRFRDHAIAQYIEALKPLAAR